jgi:hypothetical protein
MPELFTLAVTEVPGGAVVRVIVLPGYPLPETVKSAPIIAGVVGCVTRGERSTVPTFVVVYPVMVALTVTEVLAPLPLLDCTVAKTAPTERLGTVRVTFPKLSAVPVVSAGPPPMLSVAVAPGAVWRVTLSVPTGGGTTAWMIVVPILDCAIRVDCSRRVNGPSFSVKLTSASDVAGLTASMFEIVTNVPAAAVILVQRTVCERVVHTAPVLLPVTQPGLVIAPNGAKSSMSISLVCMSWETGS